MASSVDVKTQPVTRDVLAQIAGNQRLIKLLENLAGDVANVLPSAIDDVAQDVGAAATATAVAQSVALLALSAADQADDMLARLAALESRVADLERAVAETAGDPTP